MSHLNGLKLYHYTAAEVFLRILEKKEIWFTDFRFMNDAEEFSFANTIIQNTINAYDFDAKKADFLKKFTPNQYDLLAFDKLVENFKLKLPSMVSQRYSHDLKSGFIPYVFSLSKSSDSLSQWRAYGNGEVCIEFDAEKLQKATLGKLFPIKYKARKDIDDEFVNKIDERIFDYAFDQYKSLGRFDWEMVYDGQDNLIGYFAQQFSPITIKHHGFEDEKEWRLTSFALKNPYPGHPVKTENFMRGGKYFSPRIKLTLDQTIPITEVITGIKYGPGADKDLAEHAINVLNDSMQTNYKVTFSDIPYRS